MIPELSNDGRTVKIKIGNIHLQYLGPKNLIRFKKITCDELITKSLMIFDSIAMFPKEGTAGDMQMLCISLARPNNRTLIRLEDAEVLESNMSNAMIEKVV